MKRWTRSLPLAALCVAAWMTLPLEPARANEGESWDDSHMQSRAGGPLVARKAMPILGTSRFGELEAAPDGELEAAPEAVPTGVKEQILVTNQRAWAPRTLTFAPAPAPAGDRQSIGGHRHRGTPGARDRAAPWGSQLRGTRRATSGR